MNKTSEIFQEKLNGILIDLGVENIDSISFIIVPTIEEEHYTNWDDIFRFWSTPSFKGIKLKLNDVISNLVKEHKNTMPLWIKVTYRKDKPVVLEISQRFRRIKDIVDRNPNNLFAPFEVGNRYDIEQIVESERTEAIRILMYKRAIDERTKEIIGDEIHISELEDNFKSHLDIYRFYPANPKHQNVGDDYYSKFVINQDYKSGNFSICDAANLEHEINSKLSKKEAIEYYVKHMIKHEIFGIKIKH